MTCKLPDGLRKIIERYRDCNAYSIQVTGEMREKVLTRPSGGFGYADVACEDALRDNMATAGSGLLGQGVHRSAFDFQSKGGEDCVVKVARDIIQGSEANRLELRAYQSIPRKAKEIFASTDDADPKGLWITQERATTYYEEDPDEAEKIEERVSDRLEDAGIKCGDVHTANVGTIRGRPVVIDYGFGIDNCELVSTKKALGKAGISTLRRERIKMRRSSGQRSILMYGKRRRF